MAPEYELDGHASSLIYAFKRGAKHLTDIFAYSKWTLPQKGSLLVDHVIISNCPSTGGPEHEFINPSLEAAQQNFRKKLHALLHSVAMNTYVDYKADRDIQSVQKDLRESNREKYRNIVDKLNNEATEAYTAYEQLVRLARRVLT
ncbi:MAG: hypothetical protein IPK73_31220 [Candidatus Obscuribacter sp.]|nr:hypothetical protein [Candidatus Obscuribacter sp.]